VTGARVRKIVTGASGLAEGAIWVDREGDEHLQKAQVVVLCANGIGTARLLLLSADQGSHRDGLANSSGLVGKNLMLHPNCAVMGYYDEDLNSWRGPAGELVHSMEFYDTRPEHGFVRGSKLQALALPGPLTTVEFHRRLGFDRVWGASFHEVARRHGRGLLWCANTEDLPEESNRITLDDRLTDSDGIPAPRVHYRISENTRSILKFTVERLEELHAAGSAVETFSTELVVDQPGHLLGTARMGDDPARSVTDSFGRCHDVDNLFIADGSLMVTSGAANPTCTIAALALRVGQQIAETARLQPVPAVSD
jgi:choline dehydrogenase-like flavoprotein